MLVLVLVLILLGSTSNAHVVASAVRSAMCCYFLNKKEAGTNRFFFFLNKNKSTSTSTSTAA